MMYGCAIADIVERQIYTHACPLQSADQTRFTGALPLLLADVTYGACCESWSRMIETGKPNTE